jgi:hypothetical protein
MSPYGDTNKTNKEKQNMFTTKLEDFLEIE